MKEIIEAILNNSKDDPDLTFGTYECLRTVLCVIIIIVNLIVVLSSGLLLHRGQQPRSTYIFLGNIALSDMILGAVTLFFQFFRHQLHSQIECSISLGCEITASLVSIFSIGLIGIDRFLYIMYGLYYTRYITSKRSHCMVFSTWLFGGLLGFTPLFVGQNSNSNSNESIICWYAVSVPPQVTLVLAAVGFLPMLLVLVLYTIILKNALNTISTQTQCIPRIKTESNVRREQSTPGGISTTDIDNDDSSKKFPFGLLCCKRTNRNMEVSPQCIESKWKAVKVVVFITGAFSITWFPFIVTLALHAFCDYHLHPQDCIRFRMLLHKPLGLLCLSNSLLNPIIYAWWHNGFRESMKKLCKRFFVQRC